MRKLITTAFVLLATIFVVPSYGTLTSSGCFIKPSDKHIYYTGRIDASNPDQPILFWSNSSIAARFTGSSIKVVLNDSTGNDTFHIVVDGNEETAKTLKCKKGTNVYDIASGLNGDDHKIIIAKRSEYDVGSTAFCGFILDDGKELSKYPIYIPRRRIEFYGDSITCGMGNEDLTLKNNSDMNLENGYMTYAAMTARNLNAQSHVVSKSGIGFMVSWGDVIMPEIYDRLNPNDPESKWDFTSWVPDVVVVNLGTNDYWLCPNRFNPAPSELQIVEAYVDFILKLRSKYSSAFILCTLGNMNSTDSASPFPGYIRQAVSVLKEKYGEKRIDSLFFEYKKTDGHPVISEHKAMAEPLTAKIAEIMDWQVEIDNNEIEGN